MNKCYVVSGIVQGVGFRYTVFNFANKYFPDIKGYIKNLSDGRVEICVSGDSERVKKFIDEIKEIRFYGYIEDIKEDKPFLSGHYNNFMIEY
ncbi:MAG: acylphosphatase [Proteobacteria bacterium]|nr:acylphosphatase [Pseudomonadota bacterium]